MPSKRELWTGWARWASSSESEVHAADGDGEAGFLGDVVIPETFHLRPQGPDVVGVTIDRIGVFFIIVDSGKHTVVLLVILILFM